MFYSLLYNIYAEYQSGTLMVVASSTMMIAGASTPLFARASDIFGRRPVLHFSVALLSLAYILLGTASGGVHFLIAQSVLMVAFTMLATLMDILVADFVPLQLRPAFYGLIQFPSLAWAYLGTVLINVIPSWKYIMVISVPIVALCFGTMIFALHTKGLSEKVTKKYLTSSKGSLYGKLNISGMVLICLSLGLIFIPVNIFIGQDILSRNRCILP